MLVKERACPWGGEEEGRGPQFLLSLGVSLIQTRTPENILEQMDSFHNHQAKGWAERTLRHMGRVGRGGDGDARDAGTS